MAKQADKSDDTAFRPVIKIKASPIHVGSTYYFTISSAFIANSVIVPEHSYYLFVTEEVNKKLFGVQESHPPKYFDETMFQPIVQLSAVPKKSHNQYYFKIDQDFITRGELLLKQEYNLFIFQSDELKEPDHQVDSHPPNLWEFDATCFMPVLRIIASIHFDRNIYTFPIPTAFVESENILPDHRYWIYVTKSIEKAKPHAKASKKKGDLDQE